MSRRRNTIQKHSIETRRKMSQKKQGSNNPMFKQNHSKETRQKMSVAKRGKKSIHNKDGAIRFVAPEEYHWLCMLGEWLPGRGPKSSSSSA
jgi:hypothetical protein